MRPEKFCTDGIKDIYKPADNGISVKTGMFMQRYFSQFLKTCLKFQMT